jgi:hypothetical protein
LANVLIAGQTNYISAVVVASGLLSFEGVGEAIGHSRERLPQAQSVTQLPAGALLIVMSLYVFGLLG